MTDLKNKTVPELTAWAERESYHEHTQLAGPWTDISEELARRLEEAQQTISELSKLLAVTDAEVAAKALEAFLARYHSKEPSGDMKGSRSTSFANEMIAEYRAKAGRKE